MKPLVCAAGILFLGMCGGCSRKQAFIVPPVNASTPEPLTAKPVEPPKPEPIKLGEPPRLPEEPR